MFLFWFFGVLSSYSDKITFLSEEGTASLCGCACVFICWVLWFRSVPSLCIHPSLDFPRVSSVLLCPVYAQVSRAAALLKEQGSLTRVGGWSLAVLHEASRILIWGS